ncbi:response regulator [Desulfonatronum sp. SC1]|uniref:response regulator n=1 Tax=Desulfonatronum sp. SC1 TaxID=2109626 RepID=UPI000D3169EF|nr:response regulator [Desulfonatronum sp. SC1]PTN33160.1 hypothetical protein C6366_14920 [Desulfonatronum sp. SC1]
MPSPLTTADAVEKKTVRVLVAEDVDLNRQYLAFLLNQQGYLHDMVSSGLEAVQAFQRQTYDIILMDIQMPIMDGLEATAKIRALEREQGLPCTPIIALTAYAMPEEQETFLNSGMDGFVPKPIQGDTLQTEILRLLPVRVSTARPPVSPPVFNLQDVKTRFLGNDKLWRTIVLRFSKEELPEYLDQIQNLLQVSDLQETARLAHKIKGALGTLCADPARKAALAVEKAAKSDNSRKTEDALRALLAELKRIPEAPVA